MPTPFPVALAFTIPTTAHIKKPAKYFLLAGFFVRFDLAKAM